MSRIALVLAGGDPPPPSLFSILPPPLLSIAADSGVHHARALEVPVDVVVGDLDSAAAADIRWAIDQGADVDRHPRSKDQTDLELALARAVTMMVAEGVDELAVVGLGGGRLDHWLANLLTVAGPLTQEVTTTAYIDRSRVSVIRTRRTITGRPGELISLIPVGGPVEGITTTGLAYPLDHEGLAAGESRGVSNLFEAVPDERQWPVTADIAVETGTLVAIQPDFLVPRPHHNDGPSTHNGGSEGPTAAPDRR